MVLGKRHGLFIITIFFVFLILVCSSGCIQPTNVKGSSSSGQDSTRPPVSQGPAAGSSPAPSDQAHTQTSELINATDNGTLANMVTGAKYLAGSSVQKDSADSSYDRDRGWVIVKVNNDTYTIGQIYYDPEARVWFKVSDEMLVNRVFHAVERDYPVLKGMVTWDNLPTKHGVVDQFGTTRLEW